MTEITSNNFEQSIGSDKPVLVDFWAEWCGPCRMVSYALNDLHSEMDSSVNFVKLNIDDSPDLAERFAVQSIPTLILFKNGREIGRSIGASSKQSLKTFIESSISTSVA